ncbi:MAG: RidA family protein [Betaproteobacteria bacterium]|nr:RidA family protein [Betaproteobacteria bacterium]
MVATEKEKIPGPIGKYSQVRVVPIGNAKMLFLSGMATVGEFPFDIQKQAEAIFRRMNQLLEQHGASLADLVKITAFLADIRGEYQKYNEVRNRVFENFPNLPASSSVGITMNLNAELRIEIEGVAVIQG